MKLQGVVFDWAGTLVDFGSCAPIAALREVFAEAGLAVSERHLRAPMGLAKRDHIAAVLAALNLPASRLDGLYARFLALQPAHVARRAQPLPGVAAVAGELRARGLRIGTTTGYNRAMLDLLLREFTPDAAVCPDDVAGRGRPAPFLCYLVAARLQTWLPAMIKIGDTPSDMHEGRNAGMWTVGITRTGNEVGLSLPEWEALPPAGQVEALATAASALRGAGAHAVAASVAECLPAIDEIAARLARGERP